MKFQRALKEAKEKESPKIINEATMTQLFARYKQNPQYFKEPDSDVVKKYVGVLKDESGNLLSFNSALQLAKATGNPLFDPDKNPIFLKLIQNATADYQVSQDTAKITQQDVEAVKAQKQQQAAMVRGSAGREVGQRAKTLPGSFNKTI